MGGVCGHPIPGCGEHDAAGLARSRATDSGGCGEGFVNSPDEASSGRQVHGASSKLVDAPETAAETHAVLRAKSGFDINQLVAEYRALRASVLRLWIDACQPDDPGLEDIVRFNEAIDQAIAESIGFFSAQVDQARNLLLGMLGHDMRSPLNTIQMTASYLAALNAGDEVSEAASRLIRSGCFDEGAAGRFG